MSDVVLPIGWAYAQIPDLIGEGGLFVDGDWVESKDQDPKGDVRLIQLADVGDGNYADRSSRFLTQAKALALGCTFLRSGDLLIARMPDPLGRACIFPGDPKQAVTVVDVCVVRPANDDFSTHWMMYFVNAPAFRESISALQSGSTRKRISRGNLSTLRLPVPPREEQNRIVAQLEELLSDLDSGVAELKAAQKKLTQYRQSLLKAAVEGALTADKSAVIRRRLGELVVDIGQGWSPKCERSSTLNDDIWAVIKTTAIQPLRFDCAHNKVLPPSLSPREHLELNVGDLLVTRAGPRARVGITCLVKNVKRRLMLCDKAYRLRVDETQVAPSYLELVLNSPQMVNTLDELKTGISDSGLNLTQDRFFTLRIPLPALSEQKRLVAVLESTFVEVDRQGLAAEQSLKMLEAQRKNILKAAFSGQLVPQDPNDEPASVLLERIRAEREAQQSAMKPRKARSTKSRARATG